MLDKFKKNRPVDSTIHKLSLKLVKGNLNNYARGKSIYELSDNNSFFSEIKSIRVDLNNAYPKFNNGSTYILHTPTQKSLDLFLKKILRKDSIVIILVHNFWSIDHLLTIIGKKIHIVSDDSSRFINVDFLKQQLSKKGFLITEDRGSFFGVKLLNIFLPAVIEKKLDGFYLMLDRIFGSSLLRILARNRVLMAIPNPYLNYSKDLNSKYLQDTLKFDIHYNKNTFVGKAYLRNVETLFDHLKIKPKEKLLDIGTGTGNYAIGAAKLGAFATGLDLSSEMLDKAREKAKSAGVKVKFLIGNAEDLPFENAHFDKVVTASVPHDVANFNKFISECSRVLKKDGYFFINVYNPYTVAGVVTFIKILLGQHPKINVLPLSLVKDVAKKHNLKYTYHYGIELLQGFPIPWSWKWGLVNKFDKFDKALSTSKLNFLYSQYLIVFKKNRT